MLPVIPKMRVNESPMSWIARISFANGMGHPYILLKQFRAIKGYCSPLSIKLDMLSECLGKDREYLRNIQHDHGRLITWFGHRLLKNSRKIKVGVCTECLKENEFAKAIWDLSFITSCPSHRMLLVTDCRTCGQPISWVRPDLCSCNCGSRLFGWFGKGIKVSVRQTVSEDVLLFHKIIEELAFPELGNEHPIIYGYPIWIERASLSSIFQLLEMLSYMKCGASTRYWRSDEFVSIGASVLKNWPNSFYELMARRFSEGIDSGRLHIRYLTKALGRMCWEDWETASRISIEINNFLVTNSRDRICNSDFEIIPDKYISIKNAANDLGLQSRKLHEILVRKNISIVPFGFDESPHLLKDDFGALAA